MKLNKSLYKKQCHDSPGIYKHSDNLFGTRLNQMQRAGSSCNNNEDGASKMPHAVTYTPAELTTFLLIVQIKYRRNGRQGTGPFGDSQDVIIYHHRRDPL